MKNFFLWCMVLSIFMSATRAQDGSVSQSRIDVAVEQVKQDAVSKDTTLSLPTPTVSGGENMCGDGISRNGEQCDDGNYDNGDGCDSNCKIEEVTAAKKRPYNVEQKLCPSSCVWSWHYNRCECASGRTIATGTGSTKEYVGHVTLNKRELPPKKRVTIFIDDVVDTQDIVSPRDPASGQATGKRSAGTGVGPDMEPDLETLYTGPCKPPYLCDMIEISRDIDLGQSQKSNEDVYVWKIKAPRDVATGQSSGKRQHGSVKIAKEWGKSTALSVRSGTGYDEDCDGSVDDIDCFVYPILPAWTGRLEEIPVDDDITMEMKRKGRDGSVKGIITAGDSEIERVSPRDAASGLATGKRQHKPYRLVMEAGDCDDEDCDMVMVVEADLDGDGEYETHIGLNGLAPGQALRVIDRSMRDLATGKK